MTRILILSNIIVLLFISFFIRTQIETDELIFNYFSTQLSYAQIETIITNQQKYEWVGYLLIPIVYFLKISLITLCIYTGVLLSNVSSFGFSKIFSGVVLADILFLIPGFIKIIWFSFQSDYTLEDIQYFMPGSLLNFFDPKLVEPWLVYPLQSLNIWEVVFWFALAYRLKKYLDNDFHKSFGIVMASYGSGFLLWIVFIVFLTLNFT